jgi:hypothetical protein
MRSTLKNSTPVEAASRRRAYAERLAVYHLEAALLEQARLGDAYNRAVDTSAEQSCFLRLEAASLDVSRCDLAVKGASSSHA